MKKIFYGFIFSLFFIQNLFAAVPVTFTNGTVADATEVNSNFDYFENKFSTTGGHDHDGSDSKTITTLGTITSGTWQGTILDTAYGGLGAASTWSTGDIVQATSDTVLGRLIPGTKGQAVTSNGANVEVSYQGMTTQGDIEYFDGSVRQRLAAGTNGYYLKTQGAGANPAWADFGALTTVTHQQLFTSSDTWTAPAGVSRVYVSLCGGGGGGEAGISTTGPAGGGGGAGAFIIRAEVNVTASTGYTVTVGSGGTGGAGSGADGSAGGNSSFAGDNVTITCNGGSGGSGGGTGGAGGTSSGTGAGSNNSGGTGGAGGQASTTAGAAGGNGSGTMGGGGGGAGSLFGKGGAGASTTGGNGNNGTGFGSGGGGGYADNGSAGGNGAAGMVLVQW